VGSSLQLRFVIDDDGVVMLSMFSTASNVLEQARIAVLKEPFTSMSVAATAHALVRTWLAPELATDAADALWSTFDALTTPF
jgi:hypothetical protein